MTSSENDKKALDFLTRTFPNARAETGIILGTGLSSLSQFIEISDTIPFDQIPGFHKATVEGHKGNLVFGSFQGRRLIILQGRLHFYEGYSMQDIVRPVKIMKHFGVDHLIVTNAAGGLNPDFDRGDIMMISDHINLFPSNPLIGPNENTYGPRFPDFSEVYDKNLIDKSIKFGHNQGIRIHSGVYVGLSGPCLETPAEYKYLRIIGGDAVGMSTIPEVITAVHSGMKVTGISVITDLGVVGKIRKVSFEEIKSIADQSEPKVSELVKNLLKNHR